MYRDAIELRVARARARFVRSAKLKRTAIKERRVKVEAEGRMAEKFGRGGVQFSMVAEMRGKSPDGDVHRHCPPSLCIRD